VSRAHHAHREAQHAGGIGSAVDEVAEEDHASALGVHGVDGSALGVAHELVAELCEQGFEFGAAAVHIADGVEGPAFLAPVVEQGLAHEPRLGHLLLARQQVHLAEPLLAEVFQRPSQLVVLPLDHRGPERAVGALGVAFDAHALGDVEHDRHGQHIVFAGEFHEGPP
jgi:hypothetical protein